MLNFLDQFGSVISAVIAVLLFIGLDGKALKTHLGIGVSAGNSGSALSWRFRIALSLAVGALVWSAITTYRLSKLEVGVEDIESNVVRWSETFGFATRKGDPNTATYFSRVLTLTNGIPVTVVRPKEQGNYLVLASSLGLSPEHREKMLRLSASERTTVLRTVLLELARARIGYNISADNLVPTILVSKRVPITSQLTEAVFVDAVLELESALTLARESLVLKLEEEAEQARH